MSQPLVGYTILVTRPAGQEVELCSMLRDLGATVYHWPALIIEPLENWSAFDAAIRNLDLIDWAVFTSANGVRMCLERMNQLGLSPALLERCQIAAIGPATAQALKQSFQSTIVVPDRHDTSALIDSLQDRVVGKRVALFRAEEGRTDLRDALAKIARLEDITVYRQRETSGPSSEIQWLLESGSFQMILLTSGNGARAIIQHLSPTVRQRVIDQSVLVVVNSAATAEVVTKLSLPVAEIADGSTDQILVAAVIRQFERRQGSN